MSKKSKHVNEARDALAWNLKVELFDVWGIHFMELFVSSNNNLYIPVAVDYVSK